MKKKIAGYVLVIIGLALLVISLGLFKLNIPALDNLLTKLKPIYVTFAGLILAIIGAFLGFGKSGNSSRQKETEVPIYKGKEIVGYRRGK